jgi:hypothetical protein
VAVGVSEFLVPMKNNEKIPIPLVKKILVFEEQHLIVAM